MKAVIQESEVGQWEWHIEDAEHGTVFSGNGGRLSQDEAITILTKFIELSVKSTQTNESVKIDRSVANGGTGIFVGDGARIACSTFGIGEVRNFLRQLTPDLIVVYRSKDGSEIKKFQLKDCL